MERMDAVKRIEELRALLWENSRRYYVENSPTMSDYDFDILMHELEDIEGQFPDLVTPDSPTQKVGSDISTPPGKPSQGFVQRSHRYPMLSLGNTYSIAEIEEFVARAEKILEGKTFSYSCELKFDGTAICLNYVNGRLHQALTRGDGQNGDDVTDNVKRISNIPQTLSGSNVPEDLEIRGEILMPYDSFERLNEEKAARGEAPFANPRNAASGSLKLTDPEEVSHRGLWCTLYHIPAQSVAFPTHREALDAAASWGLPVSSDRRICHNIDEIEDYIQYWDVERRHLPYATDGIVIKINELEYQRALGYTAKSPRWAVAFKFQAERACTRLLSIDYQVGRQGFVTPVANLDPVLLGGTIVKRATLNNADQMALLGVRIGDMVYVEKGGEIIPKITGVALERRPADAVEPDFPTHCPDCGTPLRREEGEARWYCPGENLCPTQMQGKIVHFMSRKAMNINAGEATVTQLWDAGLVRTPSDLYDLNAMQLVQLEGWQERSALNFLQSLSESRSVPFERVLYALGIRYVGEATARSIASHFASAQELRNATREQLLEVPDVGGIIADAIVQWMSAEGNIRELERLSSAGLQMASGVKESAVSGALEGMNIVISGNFSISRDEMKALIASHGGKNSSAVSARTTFLLAGSKAGPEKLCKCESLGVKVISEEEFRAMLPSSSAPSHSAPMKKSDEELFEPTLF